MGKYESYQETPYTWLPKVPNHWFSKTIRSITKLSNERCGDRRYTLLSVYREYGVIPKASRDDNRNVESEDLSNYKVVAPGDLVLNKMKMWQGSLGVSKYQGIVSPAYIVCNVMDRTINSSYLHMLLRSSGFKTYYNQFSYGVRVGQWDMHYDDFKKLLIYLPPREEQDQIVHYLDWRISKINQLIAEKKQQIQVLKEQQQKLICEVITKGLYSNVDYKDSRVAWIGNIPDHWSAIRCKYLFRERDERSKEGAETHLSMSQKYGMVPDSQLEEHRMLSESYAGGKLCYQDDLVLNRLKAHLGVFALAPQFGVISPDYTVLIPNTERIIPSFGEMVLKSALCRRELRVRVRGIIEGFWRLYTDDFYTIYLPVPPIEEQKEIMQYIDAQSKKTVALENALNKEIELLHELRTRLISDVVTGQIDVRNVEVPDFELVEETVDVADIDENVNIEEEE